MKYNITLAKDNYLRVSMAHKHHFRHLDFVSFLQPISNYNELLRTHGTGTGTHSTHGRQTNFLVAMYTPNGHNNIHADILLY